jgi:hypothetical protein
VVFQVIEHIALDKLEIFLNEIKRVTCSDGQVIFTTPNRKIRLLPFQKPWNKFHTKEYSAEDLRSLLGRYFLEVKVDALFGTKQLNKIERNRVRQKPVKVYLKKPLKGYLVNPIRNFFATIFGSKKNIKNPASIGTRKHNKKPINVNPESVHYPFTVDDLEIREDSLNEGLDLRASILRVK